MAEEAFRSFLGAPIMHQRQVVGILVVQQKESRLSMRGGVLMVTLAAQLAARIAQAQAKGWLQKTDWSKPLRGIAGASGTPSPRPGVASAQGAHHHAAQGRGSRQAACSVS